MDEKLYFLYGVYIDGSDFEEAPLTAQELGETITRIANEVDITSLVISDYEQE